MSATWSCCADSQAYKHSQQNFLSDSKSEGMINYSPILTQDEKLNLTTYLLIINTIVLLSRTKSENLSNLQHSSSSSLPVSLRLPLSPTTIPRLTPKPKSTNTTKPTAIRPHTPDLTNSRPKSPSQINLSNLVENWATGYQIHHNQSQPLRSTYPPSQTTLKAVLTILSTRVRDVPCTINPRFESGVTVDLKPLPDHNLPQRTLTIQALPPSEHPESNRSNTPGQSQPEHLPNHQLSSKLEIECKDEDSEEEDTDDDVLGNEKLDSAQTHLSPKDEILPISGPLREALPIINLDIVKLREIWIGAMFRPAIVHLKCLLLIRLARLSKLVHQKITILIGDLTKERDRASAKAQKSGGSETNEMVRIIKKQALKFEEERHWLTSKLVKLTSSNQVLERGII
ncbi:hypothetical protein BY996DRAFT_6604035 [Phakopsora pachyrhizi]|nr:hypothetical protein BY996DRAFT_6604035 [Phakopsora pachyrhizi]